MSQTIRIWAITSYRAGENTQILSLAERLADRLRSHLGGAASVELLTLRPNHGPWAGPLALLRQVSLPDGSLYGEILKKNWPDIVVSSALKNEPIARWLKKRSQGRSRLVFLGRTWAAYEHFDLIVTTPQYRLPHRPNILENETTIHGLTSSKLQRAKEQWREHFADLPSPRRTILIGGDSGPYAMREGAMTKLAQLLIEDHQQRGGSLLLSTSARTHAAARTTITNALPRAFQYHYRANDSTNPYLGMLAWADELVVTSDSIAMISEALACGVPVRLFDLHAHGDRTLKSLAYRSLMALLPFLARDIRLAHQRLFDQGWLMRWNDPVQCHQGKFCGDAAEESINRILAEFDLYTRATSEKQSL